MLDGDLVMTGSAPPSDSLAELQDKMREYMDNGVRLGCLVGDPSRWCFVPAGDPLADGWSPTVRRPSRT